MGRGPGGNPEPKDLGGLTAPPHPPPTPAAPEAGSAPLSGGGGFFTTRAFVLPGTRRRAAPRCWGLPNMACLGSTPAWSPGAGVLGQAWAPRYFRKVLSRKAASFIRSSCGRREAWGTEGHSLPRLPPPPGHAAPPSAPRGGSRSAQAPRQGPEGCPLRQRCKARHEAAAPPAARGHRPPPRSLAQPTWEQVVGQLPVQPVLQHQKQSELGRRRGVVGWRFGGLPRSRLPHSSAALPGPAHMPARLVLASLQVALHLDDLQRRKAETHRPSSETTCCGPRGVRKGQQRLERGESLRRAHLTASGLVS